MVAARCGPKSGPRAPVKIAFAVRALEATGQSDDAEPLYKQGYRWWPPVDDFLGARVSGMIDRGDYAGVERLGRGLGHAKAPIWFKPLPRIAAAAQANSVSEAKEACPVPGTDSLESLFCISVLAKLGDPDDAFAIADHLYPNRVGRTAADEDRIFFDRPAVNGTEYVVGPGAAALRRDPRYLALAQRTGLLAYWRSGRLPDFCQPPKPEPICRGFRR